VQLYSGSAADFIRDSVRHEIAEKLGESFYDYYRFRANVSEFTAWQNSLQALSGQLMYAGLHDTGVILEMQLPMSSARLDCLLFGQTARRRDAAVLIELKQWTHAQPSDFDDCVISFVGRKDRAVPHPSRQALSYATYLQDTNTAMNDPASPVALQACSWLHNMTAESATAVRADKFGALLTEAPLFVGGDADEFTSFMREYVAYGQGVPIMQRVAAGKHAPSKRLMDHTARAIAGEPTYVLLDEQIVAYEAVLAMVRRAQRRPEEKGMVVIRGGPGTGKSVLAINLMAAFLRKGVNANYATGSKAFTENLWRALGSRVKPLFRYTNHFKDCEASTIDVVIVDEAHRIRADSNSRFTPKTQRSERSQVDEIVQAAKVSVFFIDDYQVVRPGEVGSSTMFRESAVRHGSSFQEIDLYAQFRCAGSDEYIDWIDQLLEIRKSGRTRLGVLESFDFHIVDDPFELDRLIFEKAASGASARLTAGFCWKWSDPTPEGDLVEDVVIGDFRRPWDAKADATRLRPGIPKGQYWATDPGGINQIGCIYNAQGFEFDYCGVIIGRDLVWRNGAWIGQREHSADSVVRNRSGARFLDCVKNAYRVLLTRGLKGCYVYVADDETVAHFRSML
jgi:uncharacterized protein